LCGRDDKWTDELEKHLQADKKVTPLALGNVKFRVSKYIHGRKDIEILKLETRYMKKRDKGTGFQAMVRSRIKSNNFQKL
jgi:hypothetical protein